ncbi:MAG: hypothetical protein D6739_12985, partial [Nitrospirae bacterium]
LADAARTALDAARPPSFETGELYGRLGRWLRHRCPGWEAYLLSGDPELTRHLHLKAAARWPLRNGPLECRLLHYPIRPQGGQATRA